MAPIVVNGVETGGYSGAS